MHLGEDVLGKGLGDPENKRWSIAARLEQTPKVKHILEDVGLATSGLNALLLGFGQLQDVAVHRVLRI